MSSVSRSALEVWPGYQFQYSCFFLVSSVNSEHFSTCDKYSCQITSSMIKSINYNAFFYFRRTTFVCSSVYGVLLNVIIWQLIIRFSHNGKLKVGFLIRKNPAICNHPVFFVITRSITISLLSWQLTSNDISDIYRHLDTSLSSFPTFSFNFIFDNFKECIDYVLQNDENFFCSKLISLFDFFCIYCNYGAFVFFCWFVVIY